MFFISVIYFIILVLCLLIFYKKYYILDWLKRAAYPPTLKLSSKDIFLPSDRDERLEGKEGLLFKNDSMGFFGVDSLGNRIILKMTRLHIEGLEVLIGVYLPDGNNYSKICEITKVVAGIWHGSGLRFESIEPMKIWRVSYNGSLRSGDNTEYHVKINVIWRAFCQPYFFKSHGTVPSSNTNSFIEFEDGYEQWGAIVGTLEIGSKSVRNLHLVSLRQKYWGINSWSNIIGFSEEGTMFSVGVFPNTGRRIGHIIFPKGIHSHITSDCPEFSTSSLPDSLALKLSGKNEYLVEVKCKHETDVHSKNVHITSFNGYFEKTAAEGYIQVWNSRVSTDGATENEIVKEMKETDVLFLQLDSPLCRNSNLVGGKGASLAALMELEKSLSSKLKATVPQGFCLTKMAMDFQINSSEELKVAITTLMQNPHLLDLNQMCQRIQDVWLRVAVCPELQYVLSMETVSNVPYAVRSSGLSEDTHELSSAGQNSTYLGCVGLESILLAVQKCWASLYSFQSVQYRRLNGIPLKSSMGIIIQRMVVPEISGVMFTCDPVTGNPFETVINANYGLGETIVSGSVAPDSFRLELKKNIDTYEFVITSQETGKKTHQLSMIGNGLLVKLNLDECSANELCMSHEEAIVLAKVGKFLEEVFESPCDIEWAILNGVVYLLQCRPVTTLHTWSDFELLHEFDSALLPKDIISTANTGEVLPGATSTLTQSLLVRAIDVSISCHAIEYVDHDNLYNNMSCVTSGNHVFINILNTLLSKIQAERTPAQTAIELAVCGHVITDDRIHQLAMLRNGVINTWTKLKIFLNAFNSILWSNSVTKEAEADAVSFSLSYKDCSSGKELFELIHQNLHQLEKVARRHTFVSRVNVFWQVILLVVLLEGEKVLSKEHFEDISVLLQGCLSVISAEIPSDLEDIAEKISESDKSKEFVNMPPNLAKHWLKVHCPEAAHLLTRFLIFHGHRSIKEMDFYTDTWGLNCSPLLTNIQNLVRYHSQKQKRKNSLHNDFSEVFKKLKTPKKSSTQMILRIIFHFCRRSTLQREVTKNCLLSVVHTFRIALNKLGNLMVKDKNFPNRKLIFFCSFYEIKKLLLLEEPTTLHKAIRRQKLWEHWDYLKFPEIMSGLPRPITTDMNNWTDGKISIKGTLVYPGYVKGRACVVINVKQLMEVNAGDILVTKSTDVGWTPIFPLLSGIVTELGGLISHGAVVAREYGIPCLVGASSASSIFKTGDLLVLDGGSCSVFKIDE